MSKYATYLDICIFGEEGEGKQLQTNLVALRLVADADLAVLEGAADHHAGLVGLIDDQTIEGEGAVGELVERRESQRLLGLAMEPVDRGALGLGLALEVAQRRDHVLGAVAVGDEPDEALEPIFGALEPVLSLGELLVHVARVAAKQLADLAADVLDRLRRLDLFADLVEAVAAEHFFADPQAVGAGSLPEVGGAAVVAALAAAVDRHRETAQVADQDPGQEVGGLPRARDALGLVRALGVLAVDRGQPLLDGRPQLRIDDAQLGVLHRNDLIRRARTRPALVRARHLDPLALLEPPDTDVLLVVEDRADRRAAPAEPLVLGARARRWNALAVEHARDAMERALVAIHREDANHDRRRGLVDDDLVAEHASGRIGLGLGVEAVRHAARGEARQRASFEAAQRALAELVDVPLRHHALERVGQLALLHAGVDAVGEADQRDAGKLEALEDVRGIAHVARDAGDVLGQHDVDALLFDGAEQCFQTGALHAAARDRVVGEHGRLGRIATRARDRLARAARLIIDAGLALQVAGVARVDRWRACRAA